MNDKVQDKLETICDKGPALECMAFSAMIAIEQDRHFNIKEPYVLQIKKFSEEDGKTTSKTLINLKLKYKDLIDFLQCVHSIFRREKFL